MNKEDCQECLKIATCFTPCKYISVLHELGGKIKPLKERLSPPDISDMVNPGDYKAVLSEQRENKLNSMPCTIKEIRDIPDSLKRAVAAMLYAELPIMDICIVLDKSESTIRRICKQ